MLTAQELKIPEDVYNGLKQVLEELETGKLVHHDLDVHPYPPNGFNMAEWREVNSCGTVVCMGGRLQEILNQPENDIYRIIRRCAPSPDMLTAEIPLWKLFMNVGGLTPSSDITPQEAAKALRRYLETGQANWEGL